MRQYFIQTALILAIIFASTTNCSAASDNTGNATNTEQSSKGVDHDMPVKSGHVPLSAKSHVPVEKSHSQVPTWDELAHIHHFHHDRLKKIKRHFKKSVFFSRLLLFICHAAVLYISFLHLTH